MSEPLILVPDPTPWEAALSVVSAERRPVDADLVRRINDAWSCPIDLLPALAAHAGVRLWYADWSEFRKRSIVADAIQLACLEGTLAGVRRYLGYVDAQIRRVVRPPAKIFLTGGMTDASREAWIAGLAQIRFYPFDTRSSAAPLRTYLGARAWLGRTHLEASRGTEILGRRATIQLPGGPEVAADVDVDVVDVPGRELAERVRLAMVGDRTRVYLGRAFLGHGWLRRDRAADNVVTVRLSDGAPAAFSTIAGLTVQDVRPVRVFARAAATPGRAYLARRHAFLGRAFLRASRAPRLVYDRIALVDTTRRTPGTAPGGRAFLGRCRFGIRPWTAELLLEVPMTRPRWRVGVGRGSFLGRQHLRSADLEPLRRVGAAIDVARSADERILVSTEIVRTVRLSDGLKLGSFRLGQLVRRI